jgi:hypothetical protein
MLTPEEYADCGGRYCPICLSKNVTRRPISPHFNAVGEKGSPLGICTDCGAFWKIVKKDVVSAASQIEIYDDLRISDGTPADPNKIQPAQPAPKTTKTATESEKLMLPQDLKGDARKMYQILTRLPARSRRKWPNIAKTLVVRQNRNDTSCDGLDTITIEDTHSEICFVFRMKDYRFLGMYCYAE